MSEMSDLIERQAALEAIKSSELGMEYEAIEQLPSAQPERRYDEWCTDCKEYDQEKHCCPRFNHVIRTTLQDAQPNLQPTCNQLATDCISRRAAIKAIEDLQDCYNGFSDTYDKSCIIGVLEELPSAQPDIEEDEDIPMEYFENGGI